MGYIGNRPADSYTSFAVQHFTTSATTTYSLDNPVANENEIALFINNVRQEPGSSYAYTASGTTLTLSAATSASDTMYCVFIGKAVQTVTPASGSVTNDMLAGSIANAKLANSSITLNGSAVSLGGSATTATTNGITEADQWRMTANKASSGDINANLERVDTTGGGYLGSGMTESSGIFTFPDTGIWLVIANQLSDNLVRLSTYTTTDGTTFTVACNIRCDSSTQSGSSFFMFDVTNTSTHKVKFTYDSGSGTLYGSTSVNQTHFTFIRIGDT